MIINVDNFQSTKLMLSADSDANAKAHEVRYRSGTNPYQSGGVHTKARRMLVEPLVPARGMNCRRGRWAAYGLLRLE
ncbi:MAG: hypothetical protein QM813_16350 [Verrucomicrobiota bacterium]